MLEQIKIGKENKYLFIPKNSGLQRYVEQSINEFILPDGIKILKRRGEDIPKLMDILYREEGVKSIGLTGDDLYDEYRYKNPKNNLEVFNTIDWIDEKARFGRPVLSLISKDKSLEEFKKEMPLVGVPKKYSFTIQRYLKNIFRENFDENKIVEFAGGVEENINLGLYNYAFDIVYTGASLKENNLKILEIIRSSDFVSLKIK